MTNDQKGLAKDVFKVAALLGAILAIGFLVEETDRLRSTAAREKFFRERAEDRLATESVKFFLTQEENRGKVERAVMEAELRRAEFNRIVSELKAQYKKD